MTKKHTTLILYGRRGAGKSRTALFLAYNILYYMRYSKLPDTKEEYSDFDLWNKIISRYLVFTPKQLIKRLEGRTKVKSVLIIDDANIMFNSGLYREDSETYFNLIGLFATIRTKVYNLIVTCVDPEELVKPLKQMQSWFGYVSSDKDNVYVRIYELSSAPYKKYLKTLGMFWWKQDAIPDKAYKEYEKLRWFIGEMALQKVKKSLEKKEKKTSKEEQ